MKFLIHFRRNEEKIFPPEVLKHEQERMSDLMREKLLNQVFMNKDMTHIWLEMEMDDREELVSIVKTLPICSHLFYEIHELT